MELSAWLPARWAPSAPLARTARWPWTPLLGHTVMRPGPVGAAAWTRRTRSGPRQQWAQAAKARSAAPGVPSPLAALRQPVPAPEGPPRREPLGEVMRPVHRRVDGIEGGLVSAPSSALLLGCCDVASHDRALGTAATTLLPHSSAREYSGASRRQESPAPPNRDLLDNATGPRPKIWCLLSLYVHPLVVTPGQPVYTPLGHR